MTLTEDLMTTMWQAVGGDTPPAKVSFTGENSVRSAFASSDFAAASVAIAGLAVAELLELIDANPGSLTVDRELASAWFSTTYRPQGWEPPKVWHPIARYYETADGWLLIHANNAHHREAALRALKCEPERDAVAKAVSQWRGDDVEAAILAEGGCAAAMHSLSEWAEHPHGKAVAAEPIVAKMPTSQGTDRGWRPTADRPLAGIRVLDLTRILAGPIATRFLAAFGANVLRIDPPTWNEALIPEVSLGKRCARIDAKSEAGIAQLRSLLAEADIIVHGYRPGALEGLGLGPEERDAIRPGIIDISLDAYGFTGPWAGRRGFDSLVQVSSGIADRGREWAGSYEPTPLPFQALDHGTGYLMAAAALRGLKLRAEEGHGWRTRSSLARTGRLFVDEAAVSNEDATLDLAEAPLNDTVEETSWGPAYRVQVPLSVPGAPMRWNSPAVFLGTSDPAW